MNVNQIKNLLEKYRQGTCSPTEFKLIEDWLATVKTEQPEDLDDDFIAHQLGVTKLQIDNIINNGRVIGRKKQYGWLAIASSVLIFGVISVFIASWYFKGKPKQQADIAGVKQDTVKGWVYIETSKTVTGHIKLSDGSLITLNALSKLRYPVKFSNHKRPVYLDEGEALFNVAKDKNSPFTVYTKKLATTALGTAFNIRSYASEHKVAISLLHGKIRVDDLQSPAKSKILLPHQQIVLNKLSGTLIKTNFKSEAPIIAWKDGILSFQDASVDEVINAIQNRFNVTIKNNSVHSNWSYTGVFKNESLADVLKTVCLTEGITYSINQNQVILN